MADESVQITNGAGTSSYIAVDTVAGKEYQIVKLDIGADGATSRVTDLATSAYQSSQSTLFGSLTETAPATDTASSGINGRLQRIAQRLTSIIALLPTSLGANGGFKVEGVAGGTAVPVSVASVPSHDVTNAGTFATQVTSIAAGTNAIGKLAANSGVDIGDVDDPVLQGKIDTVISLLGTSTASQIYKSFNATSTQTGGAIWTPTSTKKIAITHFTIGTYGTTAARLILWFGGSGDTTYTEGTDQAVFKASFAPSATSYPGVVVTPSTPIIAVTADHILRVTTDAGMSVDIVVYGYEI